MLSFVDSLERESVNEADRPICILTLPCECTGSPCGRPLAERAERDSSHT